MNCPVESSEEWKKILAEANGNRDLALELWEKQGYSENESLNTYTDEENFEDEREGELDPAEEKKEGLDELIDSVKLMLQKQLSIVKNQKFPNQKVKYAKLKKVVDNIVTAEGAESINLFIKDAYEKAIQSQLRFTTIRKNKENLSRQELIQQLTAINDFANGYSILDEIDKADIYEYFSGEVDESIPDSKLTPQEMVTKAISIREKIKRDFIVEGIPLMSDFLLDYKPGYVEDKIREQAEALQKRIDTIMATPGLTPEFKQKRIAELEEQLATVQGFSLDKKSMVSLLTRASRDEGLIDYLLNPLISSPDSALALFAKAIKSKLEEARLQDMKTQRELAKKLDEFKAKQGIGGLNTEKIFEGIYEAINVPKRDPKTGEIERDADGNKVYVRRASFVQKYDINRYEAERESFFSKLGPAPDESSPEYSEWVYKVAMWNKENKQPKPQAEVDEIVNEKKKELNAGIITEEEYKSWVESVMYVSREGEVTYKRELSMPSDKYINDNWKALYDKNDKPLNSKGEMHKYLLEMYLEAQEKIPDSQKPGYFLPSIPKTAGQRALSNGLKDATITAAKEAVSVQSYDTEFGIANLSEEGVRFLPVYYTQFMEYEDTNLDLGKTILLFNSMANRYEAINEVNAEISMFKTIIGKRKVADTNSKGQSIIDSFAKKLGIEEFIRVNGQTNSELHVNAFIDMIVYGEMQKAEEIIGLSANKITNTLTAFSAVTSIALDLLKGVANNLQGNIQLIIEANSGEFFTKKDLMKGKGIYAKQIPSMLGDFAKSTPESLLGRLTELYDPMQGNFTDQYGRKVSGNVANKLFRTDTLFFNQHMGEHEIQVSSMLALMNATKVYDKETKQVITLYEAYEKYGVDEAHSKIQVPKMDEKGLTMTDANGNTVYTDFTEKYRRDFQDKLHALSKRLHGVYNSFDAATISRYSLGRLVLMYRKHVAPGYKRRFKKLGMDQELGTMTEGYYRTFWRLVLRDLFKFKANVFKMWSTYSTFEKAQIHRTLMELGIIAATTALAMILVAIAGDDDELKESYAYNFVLYEMIRMRSETSQYLNINDAYRVVKSPSAMTGTLDRTVKFITQFAMTWDPEKLEFQRETGVWQKGDNKSWAYFLKLMGYSGNNISPDAAVKAFEASFIL
jgi:hypothetical protein